MSENIVTISFRTTAPYSQEDIEAVEEVVKEEILDDLAEENTVNVFFETEEERSARMANIVKRMLKNSELSLSVCIVNHESDEEILDVTLTNDI